MKIEIENTIIFVQDVMAGIPIPDRSVDCVVTSPPYWNLRDYESDDQIGLEKSHDQYVSNIVEIFKEIRRVLKNTGSVWLNLGDTYKAKNLVGVPWRVALALQSDGWCLRSDVIWSKPNPIPESVSDRPTKAHEYIFLLTKIGSGYHYDADAIKEVDSGVKRARKFSSEKGCKARAMGRESTEYREWIDTGFRNKRSVWSIPIFPYSGAHFATFPPKLIEPCILAGCPKGGTVLDPFGGSGTTAIVANQHDRKAILVEINPEYAQLAKNRIGQSMKPETFVESDLPEGATLFERSE